LNNNVTGASNVAVGTNALFALTGGNGNVAVGSGAGGNLTSGSNNIYIGTQGLASESNTIRIGSATHTLTFIEGISGTTSSDGVAVFINPGNVLGTVTSSRRFKEHIQDVGAESDVLRQLRPVSFQYRKEHDDGGGVRQYGLVAEEVAEVAPGLVVLDEQGRPETVRYHFVNALLLNEVQRQRARIEELERRLLALEAATR
jgi:trimeric autotransporter adhesin